MPEHDEASRLRAETDRCVKCGMCLPECPTYRLASDENESPRGRIALIEGLVDGRLAADRTLIGHLDHCLGCRRCERVCPSQVRFGRLLDLARDRLPGRGRRRLARLLGHPGLLRGATRLARRVPDALSRPLPILHRLHRLGRALPEPSAAPPAGLYPAPARGRTRGRVGLFAGCTGRALQGGVLQAAITLLNRAGFDVVLPSTATCCGALARHAGDRAQAERLAARNRAAFGADLDALVSVASGCGIHLDDYRPPLGCPHLDLQRFLIEQGGLARADFAPLPARVLLHTPCSVENVYRGGDWAGALLGLIPRLEPVPIGPPGQCCGAAGDHLVRRPDVAAALRRPLIEQVRTAGAGWLVSANVGCAMHLAEGLRDAGLALRVCHPIELLAYQLRPVPTAD